MIANDVIISNDKRQGCISTVEDDSDLCFETKLQWKCVSGKGCVEGLAFVHNDAP